jgi:hypothetical protein
VDVYLVLPVIVQLLALMSKYFIQIFFASLLMEVLHTVSDVGAHRLDIEAVLRSRQANPLAHSKAKGTVCAVCKLFVPILIKSSCWRIVHPYPQLASHPPRSGDSGLRLASHIADRPKSALAYHIPQL